jgi:hypothetical protein
MSTAFGAHDQIFITVGQLWVCWCWALSLRRGRVCLLYMLLGLPNAVFLGSESLGTCDRILLSQIRGFRFRSLLRLAGSRWRYSTPPPHGVPRQVLLSCYIASGRTTAQKTSVAWQWIYVNPHGTHLLQHRFCCCVLRVLREFPRNASLLLLVAYLFTEPFPSDGFACHSISYRRMEGWLIDWKGIWKEAVVAEAKSNPTFASKDWEKLWSSSVRMARVPAEIRTKHIPNASLEFLSLLLFNVALSIETMWCRW